MTVREEIDQYAATRTVPRAFLNTVEARGDARALQWRDDTDEWQQLSFREYAAEVARWAGALRRLGVKPGDRVALMMRNIPEFHIADIAATFLGATPISIYNSSAPEQVAFIVQNSRAVLAIVEDKRFLDRFLPVRDELPDLRQLVVLHNGADPAGGVISRDEFLAGVEPVDLAEASTIAQPDDIATIIYTSGTTGNPKGVIVTHYNIAYTVESLRRATGRTADELSGKRLLSYLPMAHIAERATSHYQAAYIGYDVTTCPDAGRLGEYLVHVRPYIMFGVPRVWEKLQAGVEAALAGDPERKEKFNEAVAASIPIVEAMDWDRATTEQRDTWKFFDDLAFRTVRSVLGLDECEIAVTSAAPIRAELVQWFRAVGIPLSELYGMSETTGPMTWEPYRVKAGTVGRAIPGTETRIAEDGELLCRGGNIVPGYLDNPEQTAALFDDEGWLHTGDIAVEDENGYLRIVDRKKELLITAGGKNISPANLEAALKGIPLVGQACAVGDARPYVAALVTLDPDVAPVWAAQHGLAGASLEELARNPEVIAEIEKGLPAAMAGFNHAESVKRLRVVGEDWLPDSDVLTPTSKLKRRGVLARYKREIDELYGG